jgi:hypothetical protein
MFYKKNYYPKHISDRFNGENSLEFTLALKERLAGAIDYDIAILSGVNSNGKRENIKYLFIDNDNNNSSGIILDFGDHGIMNCKWTIEGYKNKYTDYEDIEIDLLTEDMINCLKPKCIESFNDALTYAVGYKERKESIEITDKYGEPYKIEIIENSDHSLDGFLSQDILNIYHKNEIIGYLKMKYSTDDLYNHYNPTVFHSYFDNKGMDDFLALDLSKKLILKNLENMNYIENVDYENIEKEFKKYEKEFTLRIGKKELKDTAKRWINSATSEYSRISDGDFSAKLSKSNLNHQGKGLAQLMYFHMAKHLTAKGIILRGSTNQSNSAIKLWSNLSKNYPNNTSTIKLLAMNKPEDVYTLSVGSDESVEYKNGKLIHSTGTKYFVKNKNSTGTKHAR